MTTVSATQEAVQLLSGWDGMFAVLFLVVVLIVAASMNRSRLVLATTSLYVTAAIVLLLSSDGYPRAAQWLGGAGTGVGVLLTLAIIVHSVLGTSVLKKTVRKKAEDPFSYRFFYAVGFLGLLLSLVLAQLPSKGLQTFAPLVYRSVGSPTAQVVWLFIPLAIFLLWRPRARTRRRR